MICDIYKYDKVKKNIPKWFIINESFLIWMMINIIPLESVIGWKIDGYILNNYSSFNKSEANNENLSKTYSFSSNFSDLNFFIFFLSAKGVSSSLKLGIKV